MSEVNNDYFRQWSRDDIPSVNVTMLAVCTITDGVTFCFLWIKYILYGFDFCYSIIVTATVLWHFGSRLRLSNGGSKSVFGTYISSSRQDSNEIPTAAPMFSRSRNSLAPLSTLSDVAVKTRGSRGARRRPPGEFFVNTGRIMNWTCTTMGRAERVKERNFTPNSSG